MTEDRSIRIKRLAMRSMRRGIKEMDLILSAYADAHLAAMSEAELEAYEALLEENDQDLYQWVTGQARPPDNFADLIVNEFFYPGEGDVQTFKEGDVLDFGGGVTVTVIHTPGHSDDMLCFMIEDDDRVIVGDTIFEGGPGRTWSHEDFITTLDTLRHIVLTWPDEKVLYPGHGPYFRLGDQRDAIEGFLAKDHGEFQGDAEWGM